MTATSIHHKAETHVGQILGLTMMSLVGGLIFLVPPVLFAEIGSDLHVSSATLGFICTIILLVGTGMALIIGPAADAAGFPVALAAGLLATAGFFAGFSIAPNYLALVPVAIFGGIAYAILPNVVPAAAASLWNEELRDRAIGWTSAGSALSVVVGLPAIAFIANTAGWRVAFASTAAIAAGMACGVRFWRLNTANSQASFHLRSTYSKLVRSRNSRMLLASSAFRAMAGFGMLTYLGSYLGDHLGHASSSIATVYVISGLAYIAGSLITRNILNHITGRTLIVWASLANAPLVFLLFTEARSVELVTAIVATSSFLGGLAWVTLVSELTAHSPVGNAATLSFNGMLMNGLGALASALGGALLSVADYGYLGLALVIPMVAAAAVLIRFDWSRSPASGSGLCAAPIAGAS